MPPLRQSKAQPLSDQGRKRGKERGVIRKGTQSLRRGRHSQRINNNNMIRIKEQTPPGVQAENLKYACAPSLVSLLALAPLFETTSLRPWQRRTGFKMD
jgi:hypothetical protein